MSNEKKHWHLVSYCFQSGSDPIGFGSIEISDTERYPFRRVNMKKLNSMIDDNYDRVMVQSISYLGHFTKKEFNA